MSRSISAAATAAGRTSFGGDAFHGFVLKDGAYTTVAVPGSTTTLILSINAKGEMVANYEDSDDNDLGFVGVATH